MINESDKTIVEVEGGIKVCVPLSLKYVTTFVLNEQHDWFEDEIKFLRKYIKPGMRVIDIGANYGVYTLMFAKAVGDNGYVWAFEPTKNTADFLRCSIRENNFQNISLQQVALSNRKGEARFFVAENSEMNSLSKDTIHGASYEMVIVNTLDDFAEKTHWNNLDFIKLDAEGEEANILKKGKEVLEKNSPLIMFELKHGGAINSGLITRFEFLGYSIFRLVPGLDMLIPFDAEAQLDPFLLNLFACKKETVIQLIQNGFLVTEWEDASVTELDVIEKYMMETSYWEDISLNSSITGKILSENYRDILATYILSRSNEITKDKRIGYLMWALKAVHRCVDSGEL